MIKLLYIRSNRLREVAAPSIHPTVEIVGFSAIFCKNKKTAFHVLMMR